MLSIGLNYPALLSTVTGTFSLSSGRVSVDRALGSLQVKGQRLGTALGQELGSMAIES